MSTVQARRRVALWTAALASAACLLGVGATSAAAAATMTPEHVTVSYRDLDLSTPSGASILYARILKAAQLVCGYPDSADLGHNRLVAACNNKATAAAVTEVNRPLLTALHNERSGVKLTAMN